MPIFVKKGWVRTSLIDKSCLYGNVSASGHFTKIGKANFVSVGFANTWSKRPKATNSGLSRGQCPLVSGVGTPHRRGHCPLVSGAPTTLACQAELGIQVYASFLCVGFAHT